MARGGKRANAGRPAGAPNKMTMDVKQSIERVAEGLGGAEGMLAWAKSDKANERIFWSNIYPRILPKEIKAEVDATLVVNVHRGNRSS
ncbi:hypothetical protein [Burkholderia ambifaria]|uniref:hypothetical protein n=1 Tax=Burkholderia ambifaria TaxID=152480 RepID=UPI001588D619|nr:hypothetical protein [Burkholderia ambifaria]